jgi:cyclophilin family peptidyl-prolyl cis-trans isomerase
MADTVGFEPTIESPLYTLSRRAPSTTRPRVRRCFAASASPRRQIALSQEGFAWHACGMKKLSIRAAAPFAYFLCSASVLAQPTANTIAAPAAPVPAVKPAPSPGEIVDAAPASDWVAIAASDLLVMQLALDTKGKPRRVVIQLMPAPFSQGWIGNIRKLAAAKWWDGTSINRVQDNYVVQWGDATEKKPLPEELAVMPANEYDFSVFWKRIAEEPGDIVTSHGSYELEPQITRANDRDSYSGFTGFTKGWPLAGVELNRPKEPLIYERPLSRKKHQPILAWPVHCYGMVGVGRNLSPDTGSGAELYTVIGHAPRHLDRNVALVGRVIEGIEHLSSLPRGTGALGFYEKEEERVAITSIRFMSEMPSDKSLPTYEYLSTESTSFAKYADARANRRDPFFNVPAGGADICNIPVPVRRQKLR